MHAKGGWLGAQSQLSLLLTRLLACSCAVQEALPSCHVGFSGEGVMYVLQIR
jgi:hypothetical protein